MRLPMLQPLRHRDFRLLWSGQTISLVGNGFFSVALTWQTLQISATPGALAIVTIARSVPRLALLLIGGAVADRVSRRSLILGSDIAQGVGVAVLAMLAAADRVEIWHLAALAALVGTANAFHLPSITSILPQLVPRDDLVRANALRSGSEMFAHNLVGPALGGVVVAAFGTAVAFGIDALTFAISAVALMAIRSRPASEPSEQSLRAELLEGLNYARSQRWLWISLVAVAFANLFFAGALSILVPLLIKNELQGTASQLGAYYAAIGVGAGLAILLTAHLAGERRRIPLAFGAWAVSALGFGAIGLTDSIYVVIGCGAFIGAGLQYGNLMWETLLQESVPQRLLGRITSLDWFVSLALEPASLALAAPIAAAWGSSTALVWAGALDVVVLAFGYFQRGVRDATPESLEQDASG